MKKLGIVVPYYENSEEMRRRAEYLLDMLYEMVKESKKDAEVIVIEDGSDAKWIDKYDDLFKIEHLKHNTGVAHARNVGIDYYINKVEYIGFIDADDTLSYDYIKEALKCAKEEVDYIDSRLIQDGIEAFGTNGNRIKQLDVVRCGVAGCFYKSSIIGDNRFLENLQIGEDTEFAHRVINLNKHKKAVSNGIYVYNKGVNCNSLTMRHIRGEITENR